jgi:membrane protease YdiL (CAAX protease family)
MRVKHAGAIRLLTCVVLISGAVPATAAQPTRAAASTASLAGSERQGLEDVPRAGSEFWIPFGSLLLPGLGQYALGSPWVGAGHSAVAAGGLALSSRGSTDVSTLPREGVDQLAFEGAHLVFTAGALSAWDAFHRAVPALRRAGKYSFLEADEGLGDLLAAPLDMRFLGRWTTWIDLGLTAVVTGYVLADRTEGVSYRPFRANDAAFVTSLALNAGVGEEALFRGWLLPVLQQKLGGRFWLANGLQAGIFGAGHLPQADRFALVITAWAAYTGWVTRRNDWSIREAVFQHFWYDLIVGTATLLRDESAVITLLPVSIPF